MSSPNFEIIAGTYEEFLIGYNFIAEQSKVVQSFAVHDHSSSIRSLCISGHYLATGASDDRIIVYDLKSRKEHCMLTHHDASVTCVQFTKNHSHLLSGSSDGVFTIVRVGSWQVEKVWEKAHKGSAILDIAVHSSGKLALTLGADHTLRTWNLVKGRQAYAINLNSKCVDAKSLEKIIWAEDGTRFILSGGKYTEIWSIETGGILKAIEHDEKVCNCVWFSENEILVGYENGQMALIDTSDIIKKKYQAHAGRVKVLALYNNWVVSGSSTGEMKIWDRELQEVVRHNSGCRLTCLGIVPLVNIKKEEIIEDIQEPTTINAVMKKSSVIIEIEGDHDENIKYNLPEVKKNLKEIIEIKVNGDETPDPSKKAKKKKKRKLEKATDVSLEKIAKQQVEKMGIKKEKKQKQKHKNTLVEDVAEQKTEIMKLKGPYMGCGRKRKDIISADINGDELSKKAKRRRKLEEPIKTEMIGDGPKPITLGGIMKHLEERRKIIKENKEIIALVKDKTKHKTEMKLMAPYMGCGRKRKEIINTAVNKDEMPKKKRRKLEKPIKKDSSVNEPPKRISPEEMKLRYIEERKRIKQEKKAKRRLKNMIRKDSKNYFQKLELE